VLLLDLFAADVNDEVPRLGRPLVRLGVGDEGLEGEDGGLRGAEGPAAATLLADPLHG
jgi:hypothetical protein